MYSVQLKVFKGDKELVEVGRSVETGSARPTEEEFMQCGKNALEIAWKMMIIAEVTQCAT